MLAPETDPPAGLKGLVEETLLELTRYSRWLELSIDNGAPPGTVLAILDESVLCVKALLERANEDAGLEFDTEPLGNEVKRFAELRAQGGHLEFNAHLTSTLARVQLAVMQLLQPCSPSGSRPVEPVCPVSLVKAREEDAHELRDAHALLDDSSSDEEVMRMNGAQASHIWASSKQLQDGRHMEVSWNGGSEGEGAAEWRALSPAKNSTATTRHSQSNLSKMLRVPALALNWLSYDSSSSTPRSAPSAPNSARLMISPRSAFEFTSMSSLSYRSTEPESDGSLR